MIGKYYISCVVLDLFILDLNKSFAMRAST